MSRFIVDFGLAIAVVDTANASLVIQSPAYQNGEQSFAASSTALQGEESLIKLRNALNSAYPQEVKQAAPAPRSRPSRALNGGAPARLAGNGNGTAEIPQQ